MRFFERSHIKDVLAYLRIFHNKDDAIAWSRVLNMQVGIGPSSAQKIIDRVQKQERVYHAENDSQYEEAEIAKVHTWFKNIEISQFGAGLSARAQVGWNDFLQIFESMQKVKPNSEMGYHPADLIEAVLDSKYNEYLESEYENYRERIRDIEQLALFAERQSDLGKFLGEASMQESFQNASNKEIHDDEKIVLSTIHQAKGLEWEAVFIMNVSQGEFPNERSLQERKGIEEERRLFYVAITRAKKYLHMTFPLVSGFRSVLGGPSMFLDEINRDLIDESGAFGETTVFFDPSDDVDDVQYVPEDELFDYERRKRSFLKDINEL